MPGRRGRPPKPTERKRRAGNPGKRPLPQPLQIVPATDGPPKPPASLQKAGKALWAAAWTEGAAWLAPTDAPMVQLLAETVDERAEVRKVVKSEGRYFTTEKNYTGSHPAVSQLRALDAQIITLLSLLGFSPSDRARLGLAEVRRITGLAEVMAMRKELRGEH